jgi:peptide deformylase
MKIIIWPNDILLKKTHKIDDIELVKQVLPEMTKLMKESGGIGLAAPQVGISKRFFILDESILADVDKRDKECDVLTMINPELLDGLGEVVVEEGCLSIPGETFSVQRAPWILVRFTDENGDNHEKGFAGLTAIAIQHECDHLDGRILVERATLERRNEIRERLTA